MDFYKFIKYLEDNNIKHEKDKFELKVLVNLSGYYYALITVISDNENNHKFKFDQENPIFEINLCLKIKEEKIQLIICKELNYNGGRNI